MLRAGADKVSLNTAAIERPEIVAEAADEFGAQCIVVAIDARRRNADDAGIGWEVTTHGGRRPTGLDAVEWAVHACDLGAGEILLTSMDRDGTKAGYDVELLRAVGDAVNVPVIASGGVGHARTPLRGGRRRRRRRRCSPRRSSTSGSTPSARPRSYLADRGLPGPASRPRPLLTGRRRGSVHACAETRGYGDRTVPVWRPAQARGC